MQRDILDWLTSSLVKMKRLEVDKGYIEGYSCDKCNAYNDILTRRCKHCNSHRDSLSEDLYGFEWSCIVRRGLVIHHVGFISMNDDKRVELHSQFFNQAMQSLETKSYAELVSWEEKLEEIVIEGRAGIQASRETRRKREAQMTKDERDKLITRPDMTTGEGLLAPKIRKDRQSSADKLVNQFAGMGISPEDINRLMGSIMPGKTAVTEQKPKDENGFSFNKEKEPPKSLMTQEMYLEEILSMIDLSSTNIKLLEERTNAAWVIVPKTQSKIPPDKLVAALKRLEELKTPKVIEAEPKIQLAVLEPEQQQQQQPEQSKKPFDFKSFFKK